MKKLDCRFVFRLEELKFAESSTNLCQVLWGKHHNDKGESKKCLVEGRLCNFQETFEVKATLKAQGKIKGPQVHFKGYDFPISIKVEEMKKKKTKTSTLGKIVLNLAEYCEADKQVTELEFDVGNGSASLKLKVSVFWIAVDGQPYVAASPRAPSQKKSPRAAEAAAAPYGVNALFRKMPTSNSAAFSQSLQPLADSSSSSSDSEDDFLGNPRRYSGVVEQTDESNPFAAPAKPATANPFASPENETPAASDQPSNPFAASVKPTTPQLKLPSEEAPVKEKQKIFQSPRKLKEKRNPKKVIKPVVPKSPRHDRGSPSKHDKMVALHKLPSRTNLKAEAETSSQVSSLQARVKQLENDLEAANHKSHLAIMELEDKLKSAQGVTSSTSNNDAAESYQMLEMQLGALELDLKDTQEQLRDAHGEIDELKERLKTTEASESMLRARVNKSQKEMKKIQLDAMHEKRRHRPHTKRHKELESEREARTQDMLEGVYEENAKLESQLMIKDAVESCVFAVTRAYEDGESDDVPLRPVACSKILSQITANRGPGRDDIKELIREGIIDALILCSEAHGLDRHTQGGILPGSPINGLVTSQQGPQCYADVDDKEFLPLLKRLHGLMLNCYRRLANGIWAEIEPLVIPCMLERDSEAFVPEEKAIRNRDQSGAEDLLYHLHYAVPQTKPLFKAIRVQLFKLLFYKITARTFNTWLARRKTINSATHAFQIKLEISKFGDFQYERDEVIQPVDLLRDASNLFIVPKSSFLEPDMMAQTCPNLNPCQVLVFLKAFSPDEIEPSDVPGELLARVKREADQVSGQAELDEFKLM